MEKTSWVKLYFNILKSWFIDYFDNIFVKYFPAWDEWKKISNHLQTKKLVLFLKYTISKEQGRRSLLFLGVPLLDMSKPPTSDFDNVVFFFINFMKGHFDRLSVSVKKKKYPCVGAFTMYLWFFFRKGFRTHKSYLKNIFTTYR